MANKIQYQLEFQAKDDSLQKIKQELFEIKNMTQAEYLSLNKGLNAAEAAHQLKQIKQEVSQLESVLKKSFNADLGTININKFNQELRKIDLKTIRNDFQSLSAIGKNAFRDFATSALTTNLELKKTHNLLDEMKTTMANTVKWGVASSIMNSFTGSVQKAYSYVKGLDNSLNDIRIVTGKSAEEMSNFAVQANNAAQKLGASTRDYTDAALIYYQQGLGEEETKARTDVTLKAANVTQQDTTAVSEQLTAIWNGYKVSADEAELYIDKVAKVAASTAADLEELSTGMSKVASAANAMGVDFDDLNAMLATVISVTRESPETIGTAFKGIFARMSQLQTSGSDDEGVELTKVTKQMQDLGIEILDQDGKLRGLSDTIHEVAGKWDGWSKAQQVAAARVMAGTQQYSRFIALMDNQDMWNKAIEDSRNAQGELQNEQDIYMDRTEAHIQQLSTAFEDVYDSLFDTKAFNNILDSITFIVNQFGDLIDSIGGAGNAFLLFGSIATKVFSDKISQGIATTITNIKNMNENANKVAAQIDTIRSLKEQLSDADSVMDKIMNIKQTSLEMYQQGIISEEELNDFNIYIKRIEDADNALNTLKSTQDEASKTAKKLFSSENIPDITQINKKATEIRSEGGTRETAFEESGAKKFTEQLEKQNKEYEMLKNSSDKLFKSIKTYNAEIEKTNGNVDLIHKKYEEIKNMMSGKEFTEGLQKIVDSDFVTSDMVESIEDAKERFDQDIIDLFDDKAEGYSLIAVKDFENYFNIVLQDIFNGIEQVKQKYGEAGSGGQFDAIKNKEDATKNAQNKLSEKELQQQVQTYVEMASAIIQVGSAISTVMNIQNIWKDESLSTGEKVKQTFMALLTTFITLAPAILQIRTGLIATMAALDGVTVKEIQATIAAKGMGAAMWASLGPYAAIIGGIVLAIGALVAAISFAIGKWNEDANAAKEAAKAAKNASEAYEQVKTSFDNLKATIEDYKSGKEALEEMTKGTEEWDAKVKELNQTVLDLISLYPELASKVEEVNGQLILGDEDLKELEKTQEKILSNANMAKMNANQTAREKQTKSDQTDLQRDINDKGAWASIGVGLLTNLIPGIGPLIAAPISAAISSELTLSNKEMDKLVAAMEDSNYTILNNKSELAKLGITNENLIKELQDNKDGLIELTNELKNNRLADKTIKQQEISEYLKQNNESFKLLSEETQRQVSTAMANKNFENLDSYKKAMKLSNDEVIFQYAKLMGISSSTKPKEDKGNITYTTKDASGNDATHTVSLDVAKDLIGTQNALKELSKETTSYTGVVNKLQNTYKGSSEEVEKVINSFVNGEKQSLENLTKQEAEEFSKIDFSKFSQQDAVKLGYENLADMMKTQTDAYEDFQYQWSNLAKKLSKIPKAFLQEIDSDNAIDLSRISLKARKNMTETIDKMYTQYGESGLNLYKEFIKSAGSNASELINSMTSIDWTKNSAITDFKKELTQNLDLPKDKIEDFVIKIGNLNNMVNSLSGENLQAFNAALDKLASGKVVNEETFSAISNVLGSEINQYFTTMADGTHELIISAERLKQIVLDTRLDQMQTQWKAIYDDLKLNEIQQGRLRLKQIEEETQEIQNARKETIRQRIVNRSGESAPQQKQNVTYGPQQQTESYQRQVEKPDYGNIPIYLGAPPDASSYAINQAYREDLEDYNKSIERQEKERQEQQLNKNVDAIADMERYIGVLETMSGKLQISQDEINNWKNAITTGTVSSTIFDEFSSKVQEARKTIAGETDDIESRLKTIASDTYNYMQNIDDLDRLRDDYTKLRDSSADNEKEAIKDAYNARYNELSQAKEMEGLDSSEITEYAQGLQEAAKDGNGLAKSLENNSQAAEDVAKHIMRMNRGVETLADNWENWNDILKNSSKTSQEYIQAMEDVKSALYDITGIEEEYISNNYVKNHMDEIAQAATGNEQAIDSLRADLTDEIVGKIIIDNGLEGDKVTEFKTAWSELQNMANRYIEVGMDINDQDFIAKANDMIKTSGLTVDQINNLFRSIKLEPNLEIKTEKITHDVPTEIEHWEPQTLEPPKYEEVDGVRTMVSPANMTRRHWVTKGEPVRATEYMQIPALTTDGSKPAFTKLGGGAMNNYSSKNKGGGSPGKSSGGKKGGGSTKKPNTEKPVEDKKDRYHDINIVLKQISTELDKLQKQEDKLLGTKLIDNLNKQLVLLNKQIDASNAKIAIARGEMSELQAKLSSKGVQFNADGTIANYAAAYTAQLNYVNGIISNYNSMSAEAQESYKETVEKAKEDFNKFTEDMKNYDTLVTDTIPGLEKDIQEAIDKKIEIEIEKFNMEIEIRLDLAEAERDWNEFKKKVIDQIKDDDILGNASVRLQDVYSYYKQDGTGIIQANAGHINDILAQLKQMDNTGWSDVYGDNRAQAMEDLKNYYEQAMQDLEDMEDLVEEIKQSYLDMMDEAQEKFDEQLDTYDQIRKLIDHNMKVIQLIKGDDGGFSELAKYYQMQEDNYNKELDFQKQQVDFWKQQMETAEAGSEAWEAAKEKWMDAVDAWRSTVEDAIENVQDKYANAISEIFDNLNNKVTNGMGLDYVSEEWELINKNADQYLDTINSMYGIQKLQNKYLDAIDKTDSVSTQRKLNKLMEEEVKALEEKDKLTQYDIDRANMKYEIALKQIALEEAQQNKSSMRLRRDSQGNYSYQFTADEDAVADAEDELSDLLNELYNFDLEHYRENLDEMYSVWEEYQEKMAEAALINDPEKRAERELLLTEQYGELINGIVDQNNTLRVNLNESAFWELADLYNTDLSNFQNLSDEERDIILSDMIPQWESGCQQMADAFAGEDGFMGVCKDSLENLRDKTQEYEDDLHELENAAGMVFDSIASGEDWTINQTQELLWNNQQLIQSYQNELDAVRAVINELDVLVVKYQLARDMAIAATEAAYKYWQEQQRQNAAAASAASRGHGSGAGGSGGSGSGGSGGGASGQSDGGGGPNSDKVEGVAAAIWMDGGARSGWYTGNDRVSRLNEKFGSSSTVQNYINSNGPNGSLYSRWKNRRNELANYYYGRFNTGGYTGDWGDDFGRLAILDRKELVLNSDDTVNMLDAVKILRDLTKLMGGSLNNRMGSISAPKDSMQTVTETIEQNVHIEAEFPNVKDSNEIEKAFNNLINVASQRVHRNTRG